MIDFGGTYRAVSPIQTLARIEPMLWSVFGISRVANITGLDHIDLPTYIAIRPQAKLLTTSQGKGITHDLAKTSAIMESIEGWHCENMGEPDLFGSYDTLRNRFPMVDLHSNMNHGPFEWVDIETLEIPWAKGLELHTGREIYVPYTTINVNTAFYREGYRYFPPNTNGLASGNTLEEAICHGLLEVLEREFHAVHHAIFKMPCIDLNTIRSPYLLDLLEKIKRSNLSLLVLDMSTEMQIPAYLVFIHDFNNIRTVGKHIGSGAHISSVVALSRAITEAIQSRATSISGSRDDFTPRIYQKNQSLSNKFSQIFESKHNAQIPFVETAVPKDFQSCIHSLLSILKQHGFNQVIVYNHTREIIDIPVVHVLVPGLRYIGGTCFSCSLSPI